MSEPMLQAIGVTKSYAVGRRGWLRPAPRFNAVDGVDLTVAPGETVGIVGESGCGKSTLARLLLGLSRPDAGQVLFEGQDVNALDTTAWRALRTRMQLVFQDARGALDPRLPARIQVREALEIHNRPDADSRTDEVLEAVRLGAHLRDSYPHELSGGQLQRVVIARALALGPDLLVLDEPVSALDVSIQAQIVNLLRDLQTRMGLAFVFVSHDLSVVRHMADRVHVMYLGRVVEEGPRATIFAAPRHPYTAALLAAAPTRNPNQRQTRVQARGETPNPQKPPSGCRFHPRCPFADRVCAEKVPTLRSLDGHRLACHHAERLGALTVQRQVA